jgi:hypothetical protein
MIPVLPQRDGIQDDYNDVYNSIPGSVSLRSSKSVTKCVPFYFSNSSSQEFQQKTIIPLGNLVSFFIKNGVDTDFLWPVFLFPTVNSLL